MYFQTCHQIRQIKNDSKFSHYINQSNSNINIMLVTNVCQLDQLPFLKRPKYKWVSDQEQGEKSRTRLLENLRSLSYQSSQLMAKILVFWMQVKKDTSNLIQTQKNQALLYEQLVVTTEKQIMSLDKFFYLIGQILPHQQFSLMVSNVNIFVNQCKSYFKDIVCSKFQINFGNKQFLTFGVYIQKLSSNSLDFKSIKGQNQKQYMAKFLEDNRFCIKCSVTNFDFESFKDIVQARVKKPQRFVIECASITSKLIKTYFQLADNLLPIKAKQVRKYVQLFDTVFYQTDQSYLKLQVFKNYPLLRSRFFLPVKFNDYLTQQRLDGPIFSNSDPQCMFGHFIGYNAETVKILQGNNCQQCRVFFQGVQENPILSHLRDNLFNPYKSDVFYCPQYNRFKLIIRFPLEQSQGPQQQAQLTGSRSPFSTEIRCLNYLHFRVNLRKMATKKRGKFSDMLTSEKFKLTFLLWGRKLLIMDPARGRNCSHYQFTDLRLFYLNKATSNTFRCPICHNQMTDNDIIYLKQVQILLKFLRFRTSKSPQLSLSSQCYINHNQKKLFLQFNKRKKQDKNMTQNQILQVNNFYQTLIDPYVSFNQYSLGIPDKYQKKLRQKYLFGFDQQNQDKESDEDEFWHMAEDNADKDQPKMQQHLKNLQRFQ